MMEVEDKIPPKVRAKVLWDAGFRTPDSLFRRENIWGWLKNEVNREMPKTVDSLKRCIRKHWRRLSVDFLAPYFESLPKRMHMIIENNGNKIKY